MPPPVEKPGNHEESEIVLILSPCPWCGKTPELSLPLEGKK